MRWILPLTVMALAGLPGCTRRAPEPATGTKLEPVPFSAVRVADRFWAPRIETNRKVTIPVEFRKCERTGRIHNFEVAGGLAKGKFEGIRFNDSDVYKVIEGASYSLVQHPDPKLEAYLDGLITKIAAAQELESLANEFIRLRSRFVSRWGETEKVLKPLLPRVTYREFIPGVPLIVPTNLVAPTGEVVSTDRIYRDVLESRRNSFEEFVYGRLGIARDATSSEIVERLEALMREVEKDVGDLLVPGDLSTVDGTEAVAEGVFANFPHSEAYALEPDVTAWILRQNPPSNLLIKYGASSLADLERRYGFNDMLALSGLSEPSEHSSRVWDWLAGNARPEHFARLEPQSLVVDCDEFPMLTLLREPSSLSKLAGRIAVSNLPPGAGGEFPKMRYLVTMAKHIVEAGVLGGVWQQFARERKEFGTRVVNSLKGHWGGEPFSAHNMFENGVQRETVQKLKKMVRSIGKNGDSSLSRLGKNLGHIVDSYHLAMTLRDGMFIPCSAWTWASYSYKGGMGVPTPLSLHVERSEERRVGKECRSRWSPHH